MLLFHKPIKDLKIGESFQITITESDWKEGLSCDSKRCVIALALLRRGGKTVTVGPANAYVDSHKFSHDGYGIVSVFDAGTEFPGPRIVTFTRLNFFNYD